MWTASSCLIPRFDGVILSQEWKEALWDKFVTAEPDIAPRRVLRAWGDLHALLALENVHELDRDEADFFATLDPADPRVEDVCLLADGLADALGVFRDAMAADQPHDPRRIAA